MASRVPSPIDAGLGIAEHRRPALDSRNRASAVAAFGFTDRQARFLVTVMEHSGVFMGRQYAAFARITHGQKVHDFLQKLVTRRFATTTKREMTGRTRIYHVRHKPLYAAISEADNRHRKPVAISRAIERLMLLDGILADTSLTWLGTERDKREHLATRLGDRLRPAEYPRVIYGTEPKTTARYFPDKLPIGVEPGDRRHVFLFLAAGRSPMEFRQFLLRHLELLSALDEWTVRILLSRDCAGKTEVFERAAHDHLGTHLKPSEADELRDLFHGRRAAGQPIATPSQPKSTATPATFRHPRFSALYRRWLDVGDSVLWLARSHVLSEALARQYGRIECVLLPHTYAHLSSLLGSS